MFSIIDQAVMQEAEDFEISASINELLGSLQVDCNIPRDRKVSLQLHSSTRSNLISNQLDAAESKVEIELQSWNSDSFTLEISDENGNAISRYRIMRSYC